MLGVGLKLTLQVGQELADGVFEANAQDDSLEAVDCVHLEVNFLRLHLLLKETEGVDLLDHDSAHVDG